MKFDKAEFLFLILH